jgi:hypothetical protein
MLDLAGQANIYTKLSVWKLNLFECWILMLFFLFVLYRLHISKLRYTRAIVIGPLAPLLLLLAAGLFTGSIATIERSGTLSHISQLRYYCGGVLLYLVAVNMNLSTRQSASLLHVTIFMVTANAAYRLLIFWIGSGFELGIVGKIVMGYGDLLQNSVLLSLLIFAHMGFGDVSKKRKITYYTWFLLLLINSSAVLLSFRRSYIAVYVIGLITLLFLGKPKEKWKLISVFVVMLFFFVPSLLIMGTHSAFDKLTKRIYSINILKYQDDIGENLYSSTGHISELLNGWENVKESIVFGKGFRSEIEKRTGWEYEFGMVHNELFFYWIRMGIFGAAMFFAMYLIPLVYCLRQLRIVELNKYRWFFCAVMSFILGKFFLGMTFYPPISLFLTKSYTYFLLIGLVMNQYIFVKQSENARITASLKFQRPASLHPVGPARPCLTRN